jgi:hypothetical protein
MRIIINLTVVNADWKEVRFQLYLGRDNVNRPIAEEIKRLRK